MPLSLLEITNASYRTTRSGDDLCSHLMTRLGWKVRYLPARLAIARSLSLPSVPVTTPLEEDQPGGNTIRGQQLFGDGVDPGVWMALIVEHANETDLTKKQFQSLVAAHWHRGAQLLEKDWEQADGDLGIFVTRLAEYANFTGPGVGAGHQGRDGFGTHGLDMAIELAVGEVGLDVQSGESVKFPLNAAGGSPHIAIMGGAGSGKTRTGVHMLKELRAYGPVPLLAFDFKGDLADSLGDVYDAGILQPPRVAVPLDVLDVGGSDETALREAAGRIRESISRVKGSRIGGVQSDALREAILTVLRRGARGEPADLGAVAKSLEDEYSQRQRKPDELTAALHELTQFDLFRPDLSPGEFFQKSWIIKLPQDGTAELRRLIINLTLDALDRWLNAQEDSPMVDGRRSVRHVTLLDEAHVILATKLPALGNLVRMSRSKGGVFMLVSQSPDDFDSDDQGYLDNMGLTLGFSTQARPGPTRAIFGHGASLVDLQVGHALCRIRTEGRSRRVIAWSPG